MQVKNCGQAEQVAMTKPLLCVAWVLGGLLLMGCGSRPAPVEVVDSETDADLVPVTIQFTSPKEASQPLCNPFKPEPEVPPAIEAKIADLHPADTLLDTDRQQQVWDAEHVTHMLEWRFGKSFRKALFGPGGQGAEDFFAADLEADVIELADARERTLACVTERYGDRLLLDQQTVDRPMLFTWLRSLVADFTDVQSSSMRVLFIEQTEGTKDSQQNDWRARILLSCRGEGEGGKLLEMLSEHTLRFRWSDDDELYNAAVVADWTAENFSLRESHAKLMRDVTAEVGLADLDLPDNWKDDTSNMLSMQYAVEDFNYDGFLDIALATGAGQQMLLLSDKGKRFVKAAKFPSKEKTRYGWDFSVGVLDYDRDGRADLLIGRRLYKNLGPNKAGRLFEDVTSSAGLRFADSVSMGYSIIDFDPRWPSGHLLQLPRRERSTVGTEKWLDWGRCQRRGKSTVAESRRWNIRRSLADGERDGRQAADVCFGLAACQRGPASGPVRRQRLQPKRDAVEPRWRGFRRLFGRIKDGRFCHQHGGRGWRL